MANLINFFRLLQTIMVLAKYDALIPSDYRGLLPAGTKVFGWLCRFGRSVPKGGQGVRLARALEKLGPSYVKLGQFLATRSDILSAEVVEGLSTLKDKMEPFAQSEAIAMLEQAFGENWKQQIIDFSEPIAAASVAQVHKAKTKDGQQIAVKLLRPGITKRIERDVKTLKFGAKLAEKLFPASKRLEPIRFVETVSRSLLLEMDLRMEAAACSELREISDKIDNVTIPAPHWDLIREQVLVIDWIDGIALTQVEKLKTSNIDLNNLAKIIPISFLQFALDHGVFHADQHEGNMFVQSDGTLALVDFGIVGRIGRPERRYLAEILYGFLRRDYRRVAEVHFEAGYVPNTHLVDDFAQALRAVGEPVFGKTAKNVSMGQLLLHLFAVTSRFDMHLRPELVLLQKTMVQVEGVARTLDPDHDLWKATAPVIENWIKRELGPEGQLNELADDLLDLRDAARAMPAVISDLTSMVHQAKQSGISLDDDSLKRLGQYQAKANRIRNWALIIASLSIVVLTAKFLL